MTRLVRIELLKLRTTRLGYGLLATAAGLTVLFSILEASRAGSNGKYAPPPLDTAAGLNNVITGGIWALIFAALLGVTISSGEFRHGTATTTYLAVPHRDRVLTAKAIAAALAGAAFGLVGYLVATGVGLGFLGADGDKVPLGAATLTRYAFGHILAGALMAAIGVAIGSLVRSQLAGVIGVLVWSVVVESILGGLFSAVQPYLPYTAATTLAGSTLGDAAFGPAHGATTAATALPFAAATGLLAGIAAVLCVIAATTTVRRDIS
ncbi:MAG TPA: ABC transporter permease subunit [Streptosporangiaceae bacterium]|jgi:ABC-type transport system involved in multi-copper enzyme maturation permease subunit